MFCSYYVANALREKIWFLSGVLRNESNLVLDRSLSPKENIFEFFVPTDQEEHFLSIMNYLQSRGIILSLEKKKNRLQDI